jgi:hypothetical protein
LKLNYFLIKNEPKETKYVEKSLTKLEKPKENDPAGSVVSNEPTWKEIQNR